MYLIATIIGAIPWLLLFYFRKDLRKEILVMSILSTPLAFFDLLYVPSYWKPVTFLNIPVGIEGLIFSFEVGGTASALYETFAHKALRKIKTQSNLLSLLVLLIVLPVAYTFNYLFPINITVGMHLGLFAGIVLILLLRKDLTKSVIYASILFTMVYFVSLLIWSSIFPITTNWFTFENLPKIFIFHVPFYELTFGLLFGAYWGNLYEFLFGYKFRVYGNYPRAKK